MKKARNAALKALEQLRQDRDARYYELPPATITSKNSCPECGRHKWRVYGVQAWIIENPGNTKAVVDFTEPDSPVWVYIDECEWCGLAVSG